MDTVNTKAELKSGTAMSNQTPSFRRLLLTQEAADLLRISQKSMIRMRQRGEGPRFVKLNRRIVYDVADLESYVAHRKYRSTSEYGA